MRTAIAVFFAAGALALSACNKAGGAPSETPDPSADPDEADAGDNGHESDAEPGEQVVVTTSKQLPPELLAELHLQGDSADGRLLTLAPGFIATAACSDCGAPSYLWFLAVRCTDAHHCEVLTEVCEGRVDREGETFVLEFHMVEGGPAEQAEVCAGYTGTFLRQ